ncbi:AT-hook motif nuclear-localized protein [Quillaja saponaria]|uniref:AT-hook motif nuclear-localized protein n=1 Tax=Quillaja saponaria TaxID=32244 RepID=A0AAD7PEX6_QUISA|nr:AT-hook motif nuclear-localized protein [Quillaja saponaria]
MDGREAMAFSGGSASYYMDRGGGIGGSGSGSGSGTQTGGFQAPPGFRPLSNAGIPSQSNVRSGSVGQTFLVVPPNANLSHGIGIGVSPGVSSGEPVKKKRGRPRKYGPDGAVSLALCPMSATANSQPGSSTPTPKKGRGRPPGSGRKQQLSTLGEWMNSSAGLAFAPHAISIEIGEDIVAKLLSFSQQRPRALCILSGTGIVSSVTLRQPASTGVSVTYEGRFQILCLSGSYLVAEDGGPRNRTGGVSVSVSSPDGQVIGGGVAMLIAASPVQVVACSFLYGDSKTKSKEVTGSNGELSEMQNGNKSATPASAPPAQSYIPSATGVWSGSRSVDMKNTGIDLTRG